AGHRARRGSRTGEPVRLVRAARRCGADPGGSPGGGPRRARRALREEALKRARAAADESGVYDPRAQDTRIGFKVIGEVVEGFEPLRPVWPAVSLFGGARVPRGHPFYEESRRVAAALAKAGFSIITGGGPGVMEAANRGAREAGGQSIGLNIKLPFEQKQ